MNISILTATAPFKPERINSFLSSFQEKTIDPTDIEFLVKVDHDDPNTFQLVNDFNGYLNVRPIYMNGDWRRTGLLRYWNALAAEAQGKLMWFLNDRIVIETQGWDSILRKYLDGPLIFYPTPWSCDGGDLSGQSAIISRRWYDTLGCVSKQIAICTFMNMVADRVSPRVDVPGLHLKYAHERSPYPPPKEVADELLGMNRSPDFFTDLESTVQKLLKELNLKDRRNNV